MDWMLDIASGWELLALFALLYVSGAGIPIPEEIPLACGGIFIAQGRITAAGLAACVFASLLTGDLTAYWLGRRFGLRVLHLPPFCWLVSENRLRYVERRFHEHEGKAIFFGRFVTGIRLATFLFAGMVRVNLRKFVVLDMAAAALTAPWPVLIGYLLRDLVRAREYSRLFSLSLALLVLIALLLFWYRHRRRRDRAAKPALVETSRVDAVRDPAG